MEEIDGGCFSSAAVTGGSTIFRSLATALPISVSSSYALIRSVG